MDIVPLRRPERKDLFPKERRHDADVAGRIIVHRLKRKRQLLARADTSQAGKEIKQPDFRSVFLWKREIFMEEQVLMSNANLGCIDRIERIRHTGQEFVEIDDHIRPTFRNGLFEETDATQIGRDAEHIISHATRQRVSFVGRSREEVRTLKAFNRRMDMTTEEIRNLTRETFPHQHFHHFVSITPQDILQRNALRQMSTSFTLYNKNTLHEADDTFGRVWEACKLSLSTSE